MLEADKNQARDKVNSYQREYYAKNIEKKREYQRIYYSTKSKKPQNKYYNDNKQEILLKRKEYYIKNKDKIKQDYQKIKLIRQIQNEYDVDKNMNLPITINLSKGSIIIKEYKDDITLAEFLGNDIDNVNEFIQKVKEANSQHNS